MGELGDLLEAIHDAPSASSLHAKVRHAWDANLVHGAIERANRRSGSMGALGMISTTGDGAPPPAGRRIYFLQYLVPLSWLGARRLRIVGDEQHAARRCRRVIPEPLAMRRWQPTRLGFQFDLFDLEVWIDVATGIVLRFEARLDTELAASFVVDELSVDEPIDPDVFSFATPDGSPIRTQAEMQLELLRNRGVDVSGVDPADPDAVRAALESFSAEQSRTSFPPAPPPPPPDLDRLAARHTPTGPPPDDEEDALIDIGAAFQGIGARSDDGKELVNVEGGENLAPYATMAQRRFPRQQASLQVRIERVLFLNTDEAVVWFDLRYGPVREGRAVRADGRWKVSRDTYCGLLELAGVRCPPPPEPGLTP